MNDISNLMYYDQRIIVCSQAMERPITWKISKVENVHPFGINKLTLSQTEFDPNTDKKVDGWWYADYASSKIPPMPEPFFETYEGDYGKITYVGKSPSIKIGGSAKKFTAIFRTVKDEQIEDAPIWTFMVDGEDIADRLNISYDGNDCFVSTEDETLANKVLVVRVTQEERGLETEIQVEIKNL